MGDLAVQVIKRNARLNCKVTTSNQDDAMRAFPYIDLIHQLEYAGLLARGPLPNTRLRFYPIRDFEHQQIAQLELTWQQTHTNDLGLPDVGALLGEGGGQWHFFWQSKGSTNIIIAWGALLTQATLPDSAELTGLKFFGGIPFTPADEQITKPFTHSLFILPKVEWQLSNGQIKLQIRILINEDGFQADLFNTALVQYVAALTKRGQPHGSLKGSVAVIEDIPIKAPFCALVAKARATIQAGELDKVVLARQKVLTTTHSALDYRLILFSWCKEAEGSYLFAFQSPSGESFIGRSPERLLTFQNDEVEVDAIAGTVRRGASSKDDEDAAEWLQSSAKDLREQNFVADHVAKELADLCQEFQKKQHRSLIRLKNVQHILSSYYGRLKRGATAGQLLMRLHPTPAVGGVPWQSASKFLAANEGFERRWFAGAVGWCDGPCGDFAVGIRSAFVAGGSITACAGAGIVRDSDPDQEWQEIELKFRNFVDLF